MSAPSQGDAPTARHVKEAKGAKPMGPSTWNHRFTQWLGLSARAGGQAGSGRRPSRRRRGTLRPCLEALEGRTLLSSTVYWTGQGSPQNNDPNWSNPGNWSSGQMPQAGDTVVFDQNHCHESTSTVDAGFTVASVTLVVHNSWGGTINLAHSLTLTGNSQWAGSSGFVNSMNLAGHNLTNDGTLTVNTLSGWPVLVANDLFEGGNDSNLGGTAGQPGHHRPEGRRGVPAGGQGADRQPGGGYLRLRLRRQHHHERPF
jgi:hypothetical protein